MSKFVIAMGVAPHMRLSCRGSEFSAADAPMTFDTFDAAYDYLVRHNEDVPLEGTRGEIVEDFSR